MKVLLFVFITLSLAILETSSLESTTTSVPVAAALRRTGPRPRHPKRSPVVSHHYPRILAKKPPQNVLQNGPYYINHYIYCDNLDQHTLDQIKSGSFSTSEKAQLINTLKSKYPGFGEFASSLDSFESSGFSELNKFNIGSYTGDKEIHILHLPKDKPQNYDDIKLHLSLTDAHKTPEIDLDLNKHFGSFEVNLPSIKPLNVETSLLQTPSPSYIETLKPPSSVISYADIVKPLVEGITDTPYKYTNVNKNVPYLTPNVKDESLEHNSEEEIDIPHIENHPLENDHDKLSYNSPGAVNSYGEPIKSSTRPQTPPYYFSGSINPNLAHLTPSDLNKDQGKFSYNSPGAVDSYGNPATTQNLQDLQTPFNNENFLQQSYYVNQLNEIHDINRRRRQGGGNSAEIPSGSEEVRYANHKYD